jgi:radical SAM protein with 4Fe4S-binding SPASM domain
MQDEFRIDSHKLMFHPRRVAGWLSGEKIYPLYAELSPSGACNHRCTFCALDYMEYRPRFLDTATLKERLSEMGLLGVKSVMYGGEGEPLLHRDIGDIIVHTRKAGIDVGVTTNGVLLTAKLAEQVLASTAWIKVSLNAGTAETYAKIHRTKPEDFERVFANLRDAVRIRRETGARCTIGVQILLLPENAGEIETLAGKAKDAGLRYMVVKPYSQHHKSRTRTYADVDYGQFRHLKERLVRFEDSAFSVIFRERTMQKMTKPVRGYERCLALPFWSYIDSDGNVWGCSAYLGDERFRYGNIQRQSFEQIWHGALRQANLHLAGAELDPESCRMNCRMDEINLYLWELTHPRGHVNFI